MRLIFISFAVNEMLSRIRFYAASHSDRLRDTVPKPRNKFCSTDVSSVKSRLNHIYESPIFRCFALYTSFGSFIFFGAVMFYIIETRSVGNYNLDPWSFGNSHYCVGNYSFWGAIFYALSAVTSIGFGQLRVCTNISRCLTCAYSATGLPFLVYILADLGGRLCYVAVWLHTKFNLIKSLLRKYIAKRVLRRRSKIDPKSRKRYSSLKKAGILTVINNNETKCNLETIDCCDKVEDDTLKTDSNNKLSEILGESLTSLDYIDRSKIVDTDIVSTASLNQEIKSKSESSNPQIYATSNQRSSMLNMKNSFRSALLRLGLSSSINRQNKYFHRPLSGKPSITSLPSSFSSWGSNRKGSTRISDGKPTNKLNTAATVQDVEAGIETSSDITDSQNFDDDSSPISKMDHADAETIGSFEEFKPDFPLSVCIVLIIVMVLLISLHIHMNEHVDFGYAVYYCFLFFVLQEYFVRDFKNTVITFAWLLGSLATVSTVINAIIYNIKNTRERIESLLPAELRRRKLEAAAAGFPDAVIDPEEVVKDLLRKQGTFLTRSTIPKGVMQELNQECEETLQVVTEESDLTKHGDIFGGQESLTPKQLRMRRRMSRHVDNSTLDAKPTLNVETDTLQLARKAKADMSTNTALAVKDQCVSTNETNSKCNYLNKEVQVSMNDQRQQCCDKESQTDTTFQPANTSAQTDIEELILPIPSLVTSDTCMKFDRDTNTNINVVNQECNTDVITSKDIETETEVTEVAESDIHKLMASTYTQVVPDNSGKDTSTVAISVTNQECNTDVILERDTETDTIRTETNSSNELSGEYCDAATYSKLYCDNASNTYSPALNDAEMVTEVWKQCETTQTADIPLQTSAGTETEALMHDYSTRNIELCDKHVQTEQPVKLHQNINNETAILQSSSTQTSTLANSLSSNVSNCKLCHIHTQTEHSKSELNTKEKGTMALPDCEEVGIQTLKFVPPPPDAVGQSKRWDVRKVKQDKIASRSIAMWHEMEAKSNEKPPALGPQPSQKGKHSNGKPKANKTNSPDPAGTPPPDT